PIGSAAPVSPEYPPDGPAPDQGGHTLSRPVQHCLLPVTQHAQAGVYGVPTESRDQADLVVAQIGMPEVDDQHHTAKRRGVPRLVLETVVKDHAAGGLPAALDAAHLDAAIAGRHLDAQVTAEPHVRGSAMGRPGGRRAQAGEVTYSAQPTHGAVSLNDRRG